MEPEEFPILGEPFAVELANTAYRSPGATYDFLADRSDVATWFLTAPAARALTCPARPAAQWHRALLELRDATRGCLDALAAGDRPGERHLEAINDAAASALRRRTLTWDGEPASTIDYRGDPAGRSLAEVADAVIDFLVSDRAALVRQCEAGDCSMLFVRHHHRRRWCHDGCSHRDRQARYYRRRRAGASS